MKRSDGFTLLELLMALVLAGVVALLVYGAAQAGVDTERRLAAGRRRLEATSVLRSLLQDALRNARPATRAGERIFALESRVSPTGEPADRLSFIAAGVAPPLMVEADWLVTVQPTAAGLALTGTSLGVRAPYPVAMLAPGITGLKIRVQGSEPGAQWHDTWALPSQLPRAVEVTCSTDSGPPEPSWRVVLPLGGGS